MDESIFLAIPKSPNLTMALQAGVRNTFWACRRVRQYNQQIDDHT